MKLILIAAAASLEFLPGMARAHTSDLKKLKTQAIQLQDPAAAIQAVLTTGALDGAWTGLNAIVITPVASTVQLGGNLILSVSDGGGDFDITSGSTALTAIAPDQQPIQLALGGNADLPQNNFINIATAAVASLDLFTISQNPDTMLGSLTINESSATIALGLTASVVNSTAIVQSDIVRLPEPTAIALLAVGAAGLLARRRRSN